MSTPRHIEHRTRIFARVLGPYLVIAAATLIVRPTYVKSLMHAFDTNSVSPWITGAFVLPMGLVVVALHPYWRGLAGATVSALGWLTVFKGVALMTFPQTYLSAGQEAIAGTPWWEASVVIIGLAGLYLTVVGWAPHRHATDPAV
ncbi:hypothetical protein BOO86_25475 [Mycobacterium sp. CBMA 234]|uniref:hypothetical protein n=1 Tax=Mycolicibacterium sp. CBMA 234 TaxID=1918495 RepID=UPI0012DEF863|nr:hypothetical protein [Mycolicibacterium sp. CBMA 234]MUL67848.1 hypothetical protein [Mycolicibacterium sp. CBMA 234]